MCRQNFQITDDDLAFYDKVSPEVGGKKFAVPPPTLCAPCRLQRRMTFRNERRYYHRACSLCRASIISVYPEATPFPVYCGTCWHGDRWDGRDHGLALDPARPMFEQLRALQPKVPRLFFSNTRSENSEYCNHVDSMKDCYLITGSHGSQECLYGTRVLKTKNSVDCLWVQNSELCYECTDCINCYNLFHSRNCSDVNDSYMAARCASSSDLLFCVGQHRKHHCILNVQYDRAGYERKRQEILADPAVYREHVSAFGRLLTTVPVSAMISRQSEDCTGNYIQQSSRCRDCFDITEGEDLALCNDVIKLKDSRDVYSFYGPGELCYEVYSAGVGFFGSLFDADCWPGIQLFYCESCFGCDSCFGCIGLRHNKYCILNKQYTKEEYEALVPKIVEYMHSTKEWGEFFPASLSTFGYNETVAQEFFPLTKEQALASGFRWSDVVPPPPEADKVILGSKLPLDIKDVPDDVLQWAIECEATGKPFKIVRQELAFYRKMNLPLPRLHPDERHRRRLALRNPHRLWDRKCAKCSKFIKTTYAPDRPEQVYCETCYQQTVY
jgi:hypothetical protein